MRACAGEHDVDHENMLRAPERVNMRMCAFNLQFHGAAELIFDKGQVRFETNLCM
jgi:hypothetical protein